MEESVASVSCGVLTYCRNATHCQCQSSLIVEFSTPARVVEVASSMLKLWPVYWCLGLLVGPVTGIQGVMAGSQYDARPHVALQRVG